MNLNNLTGRNNRKYEPPKQSCGEKILLLEHIKQEVPPQKHCNPKQASASYPEHCDNTKLRPVPLQPNQASASSPKQASAFIH